MKTASELHGKLRFETAQLDLIAGRPIREVADTLVVVHLSSLSRLGLRHSVPVTSKMISQQNSQIVGLQAQLVEKARADLGLTTDPLTPLYRRGRPTPLWRRGRE